MCKGEQDDVQGGEQDDEQDREQGGEQGGVDEERPGRALQRAVLDVLRGLGVRLIPVALPDADPGPLSIILSAEAGAAFQDLTLTGRDDLLVRQQRQAWPNVFRAANLIPAVEYVQANRARLELMAAMDELFAGVDVYVTPTFAGNSLLITNLTGHPQVVVPCGFLPAREGTGGLAGGEAVEPVSVSFVGRLYDEATVLAVARAYQQATEWHLRHPAAFRPASR